MPTTTEGKAVSAQNALKHGLTARQIVLPSESEADWHDFRHAYLEELAPQGIVETDLALRAAELAWRLRRVAAAERDAVLDREDHPNDYSSARYREWLKFNIPADPPDVLPPNLPAPAALRPITRYEAHLSRQYFQVVSRLQQLQDRRTGKTQTIHRLEIHGYPGSKNGSAPVGAQPSPGRPAPAPSPKDEELPNEPQEPADAPSSGGALAPLIAAATPPASCESATGPTNRHSERTEESCTSRSTPAHAPAVPQPRHAERSEASSPVASSAHALAPPTPTTKDAELPNELPRPLTIIPDIPGLTPEIVEAARNRVLTSTEGDDEDYENYDPLFDEEEEELARQLAEELHDDIPLRFREFERSLRK